MVYCEIRDTNWTPCEIIRTIDPNVSMISFGVMILGSGTARIDSVFLEVIPETKPSSASAAFRRAERCPGKEYATALEKFIQRRGSLTQNYHDQIPARLRYQDKRSFSIQ